MNANTLRRLNWLWKHRHKHDGEDFQTQIQIIRQTVESQVDAIVSGAPGAYVHLERATAQSIGTSGAEAIDWQSYGPAFLPAEFAESFPTDAVTIRKPGYYNVAIRLYWDTFEGGGSVSVVLVKPTGEQIVWPPSTDAAAWSTTNGQHFEGTAPAIPLDVGDQIKVLVDHGDGSSQDLAYADAAIYLVDRATRDLLYADMVIASGPLAYWRLDETSGTTAADSAGHALGPFTGTYANSPVLGVPGVMQDGSGSTAVTFDGADYVDGQDWAALEFDGVKPFTAECWVSLTSGMSNRQGVIVKARAHSSSDHDGWVVEREGGLVKIIRWDRTSNQIASFTVSQDAPHHVVGTYDGTILRLYIDGALVDSDDTAITITDHTTPFRIAIGNSGGSPAAGVIGTVDEVAIYDRALTDAEIAEHYQVGSRRI